MGTWGTGLWDSDDALDAMPSLVKVSPVKELTAALVAGAMKLWFAQCTPQEFSKTLERRSKELIKLPKPIFELLVDVVQKPREYEQRRSRTPAHTALIGPYLDGPRLQLIFEMPGAKDVVAAHAEQLAAGLDKAFKRSPPTFEGGGRFAGLGLLLEFTVLGLHQPAERVGQWRKEWLALVERSEDEADFLAEFSPKVLGALQLIQGVPVDSSTAA